MLGNSAYVLIPERYREANREALKAVIATGTYPGLERTKEMHFVKKDGSEVPAEYTNAVWRADGRIFIFQSSVTSQRKNLLRKLFTCLVLQPSTRLTESL